MNIVKVWCFVNNAVHLADIEYISIWLDGENFKEIRDPAFREAVMDYLQKNPVLINPRFEPPCAYSTWSFHADCPKKIDWKKNPNEKFGKGKWWQH